MKIYNDSIENAVGVNSASFGQYIGSGYSSFTPPINGLMIQGSVGIGTTSPTQSLHVQGALRLTGALYDNSNSLGSANQVLISSGSGIAWTTLSAAGGALSGAGTTNTIAKFSGPGSLTNSNITDTGSLITLGVAASANAVVSMNVPFGGTSIINVVSGSGLILQGRGTLGDPAALRIVGNDATVFTDAQDTAYFQADYKSTRNLAILSGTYGNDLPLNRLLLNSRQTTFWDGSHTTAPVPSGILEVASGFSSTRVNLRLIGTSNQSADYFQIFSTSLSRNVFVISASANVGVGTTSPTQSLHVENNMRLTGSFFDSNNNPGTNNQMLMSTGAGVTWINSFNGTISTSQVAFGAGNNSLTGVSTFVLTSTGLGINTSVPLANLNVRSTIANSTVFRADGTSGLLFQITDTLTGTLFSVNNISGISNFFVTDGVTSPLFNLRAPVGLTSQLMSAVSATNAAYFTITGSGSVGIATSSPTQAFHVQGNARLTGALFDSNNTAGVSRQLLSSTSTGVSWTTISASGILTGGGTANTVPKFGSPTSLVNSNITDNGVAVTVSSRLNVVGIGSFSSDLIVNNITVGIGSGQNNTNVAIGINALAQNPSNSGSTVAIGDRALSSASGSFFGVVAIGSQALQNNQGARNVAIGTQALRSTTTGASNMAIGHLAMDLNQSGSANVAIGRGALQANVSSSSNTVIGDSAMNLATSDENTAIGTQAMNSLTSGRANQAFGAFAMRYITTVSQLTAVGYGALAGSANTFLNSGTQNTVIGYQAGTAVTSGSNNFFAGWQAGLAVTSGSRNVLIGRSSGNLITTGTDNTFIGDTSNGVPGGSYQIAVGSAVIPTASNLGAWGGATNATRTNLGVGTFSPVARLHVETLDAGNGGIYVAGSASQTSNLLEIDLTNNGSTAFVVTGIGSVGINTNTAAYALQVIGPARVSNLGIGVAPQTSSILDVGGNVNLSPGNAYRWGNGDAQISNTSGAYNMIFTNYNGAVAQENMRIISSGFVGVGTNSPSARLHVQGLLGTTVPVIVSGIGIQSADLLQIESRIGGTRFITVDSTGELGIGTAFPSQSLHVQLGSRFSGQIYDVNNSPGAQVGIVSQVLTSTGTGVTWAPIKRNLVVPLITAFNPTQVGIDSGIFIVPQDPINGTSTMTFNFRRVNVRVETPSTGITTINIAKSTSTGAFIGTNILSASINLTGASTYEAFSTAFATGFTTAASGDKLAINFVGVSTFHQNLTVELIAYEA
jgi:hypothetical protein